MVRPAVIVTADRTLQAYSRTMHVVPVTSNVERAWASDVTLVETDLPLRSVAQCHLCAVIDHSQIVAERNVNIGATSLAQIRSVLADLLDCP
jgi:mRNA-degrading endonuclease toxin of MazEF toxin-antitoxin module